MAQEKLDKEKKEKIKKRLQAGESYKSLAQEFNVSICLIYRIWKSKKYPRYKGRTSNTRCCQFCDKPLEGKFVTAKVCNAACKTNYSRRGPLNGGDLKSKKIHQLHPKEHWIGQRFGHLEVIDSPELPVAWRLKSNLHILLKCDCGEITYPFFSDVARGTTQSCGKCRYDKDSTESDDLFNAVKQIFPDSERGVKGVLNGNPAMEFDIWIPSKNLAIEYHGLFWHSVCTSPLCNKDRDFRKFILSSAQGIRLIQIYSDDWKKRKPLFLDLLYRFKDRSCGKRVYSCTAQNIKSTEAQAFLDENHYLSGTTVRGTVYVGVKDRKGILLAVSVFRRSGKGWEWIRHAVKCGVRLWNAGEKCLNFFLKQTGSTSIKTFSDNRVHTGKMYNDLGFENDGPVRQSYEYTNGRVRRHKKAFIVPSGINEEEAAAKQGWYRVYDSGKTRWVLNIE